MTINVRQKLITNILSTVIGSKPVSKPRFDWFKNKHFEEDFKDLFMVIDQIFDCDTFFGEPYNFIFEFDEFQHFSSCKKQTLELYPKDLKIGFELKNYIDLCDLYKDKADKYRKVKKTIDFPFSGGRTAQRAYLDAFRDLLPGQHGLNPTIRISEFEVSSVTECDQEGRRIIEKIVGKYL
jgi:hypothetical protein